MLGKHRKRKHEYERAVEYLKQAYETYQTKQDQLGDVLALQRTSQLNRFLAGHMLQDNLGRIPGLTGSMLSILGSYGVESALDVDSLKLVGVPMLSPGLTLELLTWRQNVESRFKFDPEHGISFDDAKNAGEWALSRFKLVQARKVLMGAKQLDALVDAGIIELKWDLKKFDTLADQCRSVGNQLREFQSGRRTLERELNCSPYLTGAVAGAIPLVGYLLRLMLG
jgi:DNA-binding helix-hairpin-helix protein with protein kinase domain